VACVAGCKATAALLGCDGVVSVLLKRTGFARVGACGAAINALRRGASSIDVATPVREDKSLPCTLSANVVERDCGVGQFHAQASAASSSSTKTGSFVASAMVPKT